MIPFPTSGLSEREFLGKTATSEPVNKENETIPRWIQKVFDTLLKKSSDYGFVNTGIEVTREGFAKPYDSAEMDPKMRIRAVWEALARKPPIKAHCVARAVQLLNVQSIRDSKGTPLSSICRVKFPYIVDKSLPAPGGQITNEYSVLALSQLFVDKIMGASPMITNRPEFQRFKLRLKDMFERVPTPAGESGPETLSDITEKQMPFCAGHDGDYLQVPSDMEGALRSKAQALLDRQATHVRNVMAILFKLFNRKQIDAGVFELNPEVMRGGIETVNKIAEEARELLINYFGDCEETYKDGLYILQNRAAANPAALSWKAAPRPLTAGADASGAAEPARENENNDPRGP
jgi:hypothetical protein